MNNGMICIPVSAGSSDSAIEDVRRASAVADVIEIRLDALDPHEIEPFLAKVRCEKPLLLTYRPAEQGGYRAIDREQRIEFWNGINGVLSAQSNPWFDQEGDLIGSTQVMNTAVSIRSYHDFNGVPDDLDAIFDQLGASGEVIKIAVTARKITDAIPVWKLLDRAKAENRRLIPIAMGETAKWTRVLGLAHGAFLTYASLDEGKGTASGQLTVKELIETYRAKELDENTKVYGIIGDPVAQSMSPKMLNPAFVAERLNSVYLHLQVTDLDAFMRRMVLPDSREIELNFAGFSVTMPHKEAIIQYLDDIDPVADKVGAVNTVKIEGGRLTGYNTDAYGFISPLKAGYGNLVSARVAVFGAGGAARACVYALKAEGAIATIIARDEAKARAMADEFAVDHAGLSAIKDQNSKISDCFDIIVDTTPLGMAGPMENDSLFTSSELEGIKFVYDLVTRASDTPIMREAKKAGVPCLGGLEMLIAQGARQFEIWTGRDAPVGVMRDAVT